MIWFKTVGNLSSSLRINQENEQIPARYLSYPLPKHLEPFKSSPDPVWTKNDVFLWFFQFTSMTVTWGEFTILGLKFILDIFTLVLDPTNAFIHIIHFKRRNMKILEGMEHFWSPRYLYKWDVDIIKCINVFFLFPDRSPANSGGQPCKKHELYVSFSDLGWKVGTHSFYTVSCEVLWVRPLLAGLIRHN